MPVFNYFPFYADTDDASLAIDPTSASASGFTLRDGAGVSISFTGQRLAYGATGPVSGLITGFTETNALGETVANATGVTLKVTAFLTALAKAPQDEGKAVFNLLTRGDDTMNGSSGDDILTGGRGKDLLLGNAGDDVFHSGLGNDTLTGGEGADVFVFQRNRDGANVITDFEDGVDLIGMNIPGYKNMVVVQEADGVLLTFSATTSVKVLGLNAADIGLDDFLFA